MWIPDVYAKVSSKAKTKIQRVEKIEKSIKPENDSNKRKHQRVQSFSSVLIDALK